MTVRNQPSLESPIARRRFRRNLLDWYAIHRRDLPWRKDRDPYRVWLSEIMLQQTRVAAVIDYYTRFLRRFPDIHKLAPARESSVLAAWSGLGYYRRARMLHAAAKRVVREHAGVFPPTAEELRTLPGIGRYTAAAIASIAFGQTVAVVDGNVERVIGRLKGSGILGEQVWQIADELLAPDNPGDFNQAMMELGAQICLPVVPRCQLCPVAAFCVAQGDLPSAKKERRNKREIHLVLDTRDDAVFLVRRAPDNSLMPGMWELPEIEASSVRNNCWKSFRHSITVTDYIVRVVQQLTSDEETGTLTPIARLNRLALTGLTRKVLTAAELL